eukprot:Skav210594  [mRNA]  locus=scaffold1146:7401:8657:- [translate_table: standard]
MGSTSLRIFAAFSIWWLSLFKHPNAENLSNMDSHIYVNGLTRDDASKSASWTQLPMKHDQAECESACMEDADCECAWFDGKDQSCKNGKECAPEGFEEGGDNSIMLRLRKKQNYDYKTFPETNTYWGQGSLQLAHNHHKNPPTTSKKCKELCDAVDNCECAVFVQQSKLEWQLSHGECWLRDRCDESKFERNEGTRPFTVFLKVKPTKIAQSTTKAMGSPHSTISPAHPRTMPSCPEAAPAAQKIDPKVAWGCFIVCIFVGVLGGIFSKKYTGPEIYLGLEALVDIMQSVIMGQWAFKPDVVCWFRIVTGIFCVWNLISAGFWIAAICRSDAESRSDAEKRAKPLSCFGDIVFTALMVVAYSQTLPGLDLNDYVQIEAGCLFLADTIIGKIKALIKDQSKQDREPGQTTYSGLP